MSTKSNTPVPATQGQARQVRRLLAEVGEEAVRKLELSKEQAQRLIGAPRRDLEAALAASLKGFTVTDEFASEEVPSDYEYLSGYVGARPHAKQFEVIKSLFPQAESYDAVLASKGAPAGSEGSFLVLPWQKVAATYGEAVKVVMALLRRPGGLELLSHLESVLPERLREERRKTDAMTSIATAQAGHDVLVVPAQLGILHRGRSTRRACAVMEDNEFPLGVYETAFILHLHLNRLEHRFDLAMQCGGDVYRTGDSRKFDRTPELYVAHNVFKIGDRVLKVGHREVNDKCEGSGVVSAFLPRT